MKRGGGIHQSMEHGQIGDGAFMCFELVSGGEIGS